jgi:hypothetical protein
MKHARFIAEAKRDPMRIYARPIDVLRDRRLGHLERLEILRTWESEARARADVADIGGVMAALEEAKRRLPRAQNER